MKTKTMLSRMFAVGLGALLLITPYAIADKVYPCDPEPRPPCADDPNNPTGCSYSWGTTSLPTTEYACLDCGDADTIYHVTTWTDTKQMCITGCPTDDTDRVSWGSYPTHTATNVAFWGCCKNCGS